MYLRWEPGDEWQPVQRWVVWHMRPEGIIPSIHKASLLGPHPRSTGSYSRELGRWDSRLPCTVDRATWEVFRETGCYGQRYWVIQGKGGGHKYAYTRTEEKIAALHGGDPEPPAPGDLPYAEFDSRVVAKLADLDRFRAWHMVADYCERNWDDLDREERDEAAAAQALIWRHISGKLDDAIEATMPAIRAMREEVPVLNTTREERKALAVDEDWMREQFVSDLNDL